MIKKKSFIFAALIATACSVWVVGQTPPPPARAGGQAAATKADENFISVESGFSIDLPKYPSSYESIKPDPGISKGGSLFKWRGSGVLFDIRYSEMVGALRDPAKYLDMFGDGYVNGVTKDGGTLKFRRALTIEGSPAVEIRALYQGTTLLVRAIVAGDRWYVLTTGWPEIQDGSSQIKVADSFKLVDRKAVIAKWLEKATPAPLPQSPAPNRPTSDARQEGLKGKVKAVIESDEYLDDSEGPGGVKTQSEDEYDQTGTLVKRVLYYGGVPDQVSVYGYIDGKRVVKEGPMRSDDLHVPGTVLGIAPDAKTGPKKPGDDRYSSSFEYKFDTQGRLIEETVRDNRGELSRKTVYMYDGNKVSETTTDKDGKVTWKIQKVYNDKGDPAETIYLSTSDAYPEDETHSYTYLAFDAQGNWTKRESKGKTPRYGGGANVLHYIENRTISYF